MTDMGKPFQELLGEPCGICDHLFNDHVLVATLYSAEHGGLIFCPDPGCQCESTWTIDDRELPYIPDPETVAGLRALVQEQANEEPDDEDEFLIP